MRKTDILLIVLFIVFVLGLAFGPGLLERWQARDQGDTAVAEEPPVQPLPREEDTEAASRTAETERVSGMLMLHKACVNRFDGFEGQSRAVMDAWKRRHADVLARTSPEQDFHIVLAQPEGLDESALEKARAEERALCERNLEAMRKEVEGGGAQ